MHHISLEGLVHPLHHPVCHSLDARRSGVSLFPARDIEQDPYLEDDGGRYTVAEELIKFGTDLHHSIG